MPPEDDLARRLRAASEALEPVLPSEESAWRDFQIRAGAHVAATHAARRPTPPMTARVVTHGLAFLAGAGFYAWGHPAPPAPVVEHRVVVSAPPAPPTPARERPTEVAAPNEPSPPPRAAPPDAGTTPRVRRLTAIPLAVQVNVTVTTDVPTADVAPAPEVSAAPSGAARDERALVNLARAALESDPGVALEYLRRHERDFPRGVLTPEREAFMIIALVRAGHPEAARARAVTFRRDYPNSVHRQAVESALGPGGPP